MNVEMIIRDFIEKNYVLFDPRTPLGDEDSLLDSGLVDSTGVLELIAFLEERFGIVLVDDELVPENLDSIGRIARFVSRKTEVSKLAL